MMEKSKCCTDIMKKNFNKELVITKKHDECFEKSTKCWLCHNVYFGDVKVRDHCHVTAKFRGSGLKVKLN